MNLSIGATDIGSLKNFFETFPLGVAIAEDSQLERVWLNPTMVKILHFDPIMRIVRKSPLAQSSLSKVICDGEEVSHDDLPMHRAARDGQRVEGIELDVLCGDGRVVSLIEYAIPILDEDKNVGGVIATFVDVTKDRQNQVKNRAKR